MFAAIADNLEAAQWLIEIGNADPNRICKAGYSVVMYTVQNYHSQVGAYLIDEVKVDLSLVGPVSFLSINLLRWEVNNISFHIRTGKR